MPLNPRAQFIAFDLDGTLCDSSPGILAAYRESFGAGLDEQYLRNCIGTPLRDTISEHFESDAERAAAWDRFHAYYERQGWEESSCYSGIPELLRDLKQCGARLAVITNKQDYYARRMLAANGLGTSVGYIAGLRGGITEKSQLLGDWLRETGASAPACLMIGDSKADIEAAYANAIPAVWVGYGYGALPDDLQQQLVATAATVAELRKILLPE